MTVMTGHDITADDLTVTVTEVDLVEDEHELVVRAVEHEVDVTG
ncbi:hypothetical protein AB2L28_20555 [Kineococcus sp. TBRC 1896]|uniref:Uncharacterized protein n=1 Tax=Kineococcus mangrovi TaxID=1660183 RepID=A0ABV4I9F3_9ACTN